MSNIITDSPTSCFSACCWGRQEGNEMKWNLCSVSAQRPDGTVWSGGRVSAAHKGTAAEQEDIPSLALSSLILAVLFWQYGAGWLLRCFPELPSRLCSTRKLWALCTLLLLVPEPANSLIVCKRGRKPRHSLAQSEETETLGDRKKTLEINIFWRWTKRAGRRWGRRWWGRWWSTFWDHN